MRRMMLLCVATLATAPLAAPSWLSAQSTGTPIFQAPYRAFATSELGISLSDPGAGFALEGSYRTIFNQTMDIGFRAGLVDHGRGAKSALLVGTDFRARIVDHSESFPLDGSLTVGLGMETGDGYTVGYLPIGFTMGRRVIVEGSSVSLVPYVHPVLTPRFGDADGADLSIGFGVDARINARLDVRFSAAIGDRDGIGFTVAWLR